MEKLHNPEVVLMLASKEKGEKLYDPELVQKLNNQKKVVRLYDPKVVWKVTRKRKFPSKAGNPNKFKAVQIITNKQKTNKKLGST